MRWQSPTVDGKSALKQFGADCQFMLTALTTALLAAGVPKVVYLSSIGAQHDQGLGAISKRHDMKQAFNQILANWPLLRC